MVWGMVKYRCLKNLYRPPVDKDVKMVTDLLVHIQDLTRGTINGMNTDYSADKYAASKL